MKKNKKIIISILLSTLTIICFLFPINVHASESKQTEPVHQKLNYNSEIEIEPQSIGDLTMSIYAAINTYSSSSGSSGLGNSHAWVVIKNTGAAKNIGGYVLSHNASVTIGAWGNTTPTGIWFNQERKKINEFQNNDNTVYKKILVKESEIPAINNVLNNFGDWTFYNNCTHLATRLWNSVGGSLSQSVTPAALRQKIINTGYYQTGKTDNDFLSAPASPEPY